MRKTHYLRENKKNEIANHIIFFDTETTNDGELQVLKLGWACYYRIDKSVEKWFFFREAKEFWDFVESRCYSKTKLWIFAHNIVFDLFVVKWIEELDKRGWKRKKLYENSNMFFAEYRKDKKTIIFIDSFNYFKASIEEMGELIGIPKMHVDFENCSDEELSEYCKNDVRILKEFILQFLEFWKSHDFGVLGKTIASCSFNIFRHLFMKPRQILIFADENVEKLELDSYRGGRTECFRLGEYENIYVLDVNSMYPYVMKTEKYPVKLIAYGFNISIEKLKTFIDAGFSVIARVIIETDENVYGIKDKKKRGLIFPLGNFEAVLCTKELEYAIRKGHLKEIKEYAVYESDYIFTDFISYFWKMRKEATNKVYSKFYKTLMNSLYGKFGQKSEIWEEVELEYDNGIYDYIEVTEDGERKRTMIRSLHGITEIKTGEQLSINSFPGISSEVTANARMYLWQLINIAGKENVLYCDTDSLFVTEEGYKNLQGFVGSELGMLKLEKVFKVLRIHGLKDYEGITIDGKELIKLKGIKYSAVKISENEYKQLQFTKFRTLMRLREFNGVIVREITKKVKREYKKGIVFDNVIMPFVLGYSENDELDYYKEILHNEMREFKQKLNNLILSQGGISTSDYEKIPRNLKRKSGFSFDVISDLLNIDSEKLYEYIRKEEKL